MYKTVTTLRADGSPRISGDRGDLKGRPAGFRFDATRAKRRIYTGIRSSPSTAPRRPSRWFAFHADIAEVVHAHLNERATTLLVDWWTYSRTAQDRVRIDLEGNQPRCRPRQIDWSSAQTNDLWDDSAVSGPSCSTGPKMILLQSTFRGVWDSEDQELSTITARER